MSCLKVGVIGLGMGRHHVAQFNAPPKSKVVAIADPSAERLTEIGDKHGIARRYADGGEMIQREELDIVAIATPNVFHKPLTLQAFKAGCHVFCEKPMAMNAGEAQTMLAASRRADKRLMINFSYRFTPQAWALKKEVDKGLLGEVYFAHTMWLRRRGMPSFGGWFGQKALSGGGPLIDLGVHRLDLALWLMGYPEPEWIMAGAYNHIAAEHAARDGKAFDVEDFAAALVRFTNGATLQVEASWAGHIRENELMETRILGTKGGLVQRNKNGGYEFEGEMYFDRKGKQCNVPLAPKKTAKKLSSVTHFVDCIRKGIPHTATGEEGLIVMKLLDGIYKSAAKGAPVRCKS